MANRYAVASGNWSSTSTWNGGTLPGLGDVVRPSGFTVTIDQDIAVTELRNDASSPATAGGWFVASSARSITTSVSPTANMADGLMRVTASSGTVTLTGNLTAGNQGARPVVVSGAATVNITGNLAGGSGNDGSALALTGSASQVTVTGSVQGGSAGLEGFPTAGVHVLTASASLTVAGPVTGGTGTWGPGVHVGAAASVTVTGAATGGSAAPGMWSSVAAVIDAQGEVVASNAAPGIRSTHASAVIRVRGPLRHAANNRAPIVAESYMVHSGVNTQWVAKDDSAAPAGGADVHLAVWNDQTPPPSDVRAGHDYGPGDSLTGTLAVPPADAVAAGTPVDDSTGTAALTPDTVWAHPAADADTPGSIGARIRDTATVDSTGAQIAAALDGAAP